MNEYSKYSVIGTKYKVINLEGEDLVEKTVISNVDLGLYQDQIFQFFETYIKEIRASGINLPEIKKYQILDDRIKFFCKHAGSNILEVFELNELVAGEGKKYLKLVINEINKAIVSEINLDPHIKNFVVGSEGISYVDFSPPYTSEFIKVRLDKSTLSELEIVRENLNYFQPSNLLHHFLGDFFNVDPNISQELLEGIYKVINEICPQKEDFSEFLKRSKKIRALEDERIRRNIFLY